MFFLQFIIAFVFYVILDYIWFFYLGSVEKMYAPMFQAIQQKVVPVHIVSAVFAWVLLVIGLQVFVFNREQLDNTIALAVVYGVVVYGVYNLTNMATLEKFTFNNALVDTLWGTFVVTVISYAAFYNFGFGVDL